MKHPVHCTVASLNGSLAERCCFLGEMRAPIAPGSYNLTDFDNCGPCVCDAAPVLKMAALEMLSEMCLLSCRVLRY